MRSATRTVAAAVSAFLLLTATAASADQASQGRTYGGTAYGAHGELALRRPGLPAGAYYDSKVGAKNDSYRTYYYIGTRSHPSGQAENLIQFQDPYGLVNQHMGLTDRQPWSVGSFYFLNGSYRGLPDSVEFYWPEDSRAYPKYVTSYQTVLVRSVMSNGSAILSATDAGRLGYQSSPNSAFPLAPWGLPNAQSTDPGACGRFKANDVYAYAHNQGC